MPAITPAQFKMLVDQNGGDEEAARAMVEQQGMTVEGDEATDLSARPDMAALKSILSGQRKSIGDLYDTITQNIQQRYRAPDINDMLIAIGTGMMAPPEDTDNSGLAGAIQRGIRGIGSYAQQRRGYENDMNKMMSNIEIQKAKDLADLEGKYATGAASLLKPKTPSSTSPVMVGPDAVVRSRMTGSQIKEPPQQAIYDLQAAMADQNTTPQDKLQTRRNFDRMFGYGAASIYAGGQ